MKFIPIYWLPTAAGACCLAATLIGCSNGAGVPAGVASDQAEAMAGVNLILQNQPDPIFDTSAYREEVIEVEAIEALGSPTTTFFFPPGGSPNSGIAPIKVCASEGEPVPNTVQLTNPDQIIPDPHNERNNANPGSLLIPLPDPIGVYPPSSSSGTNVLCLDANGNQHLSYWEGDVFAESGTAVWSKTQGIVDVGPSQLPICTVLDAQAGDGTGLKAGAPYYHCVAAPAPKS
jgi:hypothetical protein